MAGFPLLDLNSTFREKVINKVQEKSYFRLQQTCRPLQEFIRSSPNISVILERSVLKIDKRFISSLLYHNTTNYFNAEKLYGIKIYSITITFMDHEADVVFEDLCAVFKENRITCQWLSMINNSWSREEHLALMEIVKPETVIIHSKYPDCFLLYEAVLLTKTKSIKGLEVQMDLNLREVAKAIEKLVPSGLRWVYIKADSILCDVYLHLRNVLETFLALRSHPLQMFMFYVFKREKFEAPTMEELKEQFGDFALEQIEHKHYAFRVKLELPSRLSKDFDCLIGFSCTGYANIHIKRKDYGFCKK